MNELRLNEMVTTLKERLGFVTKKQKIDHLMSQLVLRIGEQVHKEKKDKVR